MVADPPPGHPATHADLAALAPNLVGENVGGVLYVSPVRPWRTPAAASAN